MANLEEYDWMLINELAFKIHTINDETEMRKTVMEWLSQVIHFDMASFYLLSENGNSIDYHSPIFYHFNESDLQIYKDSGEATDFNKWIFYNRKNLAYRETDLLSSEKLWNSEIYRNCYQRMHVKYVARMFLVYQSKLSGLITIYSKGSTDFTNRDLYILNQLQDHLAYRLLCESGDLNFELRADDKPRKIAIQYGLTDREMEVYLFTLKGMDSVTIAEKMCISQNTLKKHYSSIYSKMNISGRVQLMTIGNSV